MWLTSWSLFTARIMNLKRILTIPQIPRELGISAMTQPMSLKSLQWRRALELNWQQLNKCCFLILLCSSSACICWEVLVLWFAQQLTTWCTNHNWLTSAELIDISLLPVCHGPRFVFQQIIIIDTIRSRRISFTTCWNCLWRCCWNVWQISAWVTLSAVVATSAAVQTAPRTRVVCRVNCVSRSVAVLRTPRLNSSTTTNMAQKSISGACEQTLSTYISAILTSSQPGP